MDVKKFVNDTFKVRNKDENSDEHVKFEWNQIDNDIYVGTNICCKMHFDEELLVKGVRADVSMEAEEVDSPLGVSFYLWLPTVDHTAPGMDRLMVGVKAIDEMVQQDSGVYIPCKNGHGRAPTMAAAYYIYKGKSADEAIEFVQQRRDEAHIEEVQIEQLKKFEENLKKA